MNKTLVGITPLKNKVIVGIYDNGDTHLMLGGKKFYLLDDTMLEKRTTHESKHAGIRARWAIVLGVSDTNTDVSVGDKVLLDELKWTRGVTAHVGDNIVKVWSIPVEDILLIDTDSFTDSDKEQIKILYEDFDNWKI